jgi:hypothetical protein
VARPRDTHVPAALPFPLAVSPDIARHLFDPPISRGHWYKAIERGDVESVRLGQRILIPLAPLAKRFGVDLLERFGSANDYDEGVEGSAHALATGTGSDRGV